MKIFLDTADYDAIAERYATGLVDGITTNPTLVRKSGVNYEEFIKVLATDFAFESISAEVNGDTAGEMLFDAEKYVAIGSNVTIKLPLTKEGLIACKSLSDAGQLLFPTVAHTDHQVVQQRTCGTGHRSVGIKVISNLRNAFVDIDADAVRQRHFHCPFATLHRNAAAIDIDFNALREVDGVIRYT